MNIFLFIFLIILKDDCSVEEKIKGYQKIKNTNSNFLSVKTSVSIYESVNKNVRFMAHIEFESANDECNQIRNIYNLNF